MKRKKYEGTIIEVVLPIQLSEEDMKILAKIPPIVYPTTLTDK